MISIVDISPPGQLYSQSAFSFTEDGDILTVKTDQPVIGITGITGFEIDENVAGGIPLEKYFRASVDNGLHWTEWTDLNLFNLQNLPLKKNHFFEIEYKFVKRGSEETLLYKINLNFSYEVPPEPEIYQSHFFNKFFSYYNNDSIKWSLNILAKIYGKGIVPKFIERGSNENWSDEDYINIWWSIIYMTALKLSYNKVYSQMAHYTFLLKKYLENKGLYFGFEENLDELYYFMSKFYDEMSKRGSLCVFDRNREIPQNYENVQLRGELVRLIDRQDYDEFVAGLITSDNQGWILGESSPGYCNTDLYRNFVKDWENSFWDVSSLDKYPLYNPNFLSLGTIEIKNRQLTAMKVHPPTPDYSGIGGDMSKGVVVDSKLSYLVRFKVKSFANFNLKFGCKAFDSLNNPIDLVSMETSQISEWFYDGQIPSNNQRQDNYFAGIIFGSSVTGIFDGIDGLSKNLKFPQVGVSKILPQILISTSTPVYIYDVKVFLLTADKEVYLSSIPELLLYLKKNNYFYTDDELERIIGTYLVPYSVNLNLKLL